MCGSTRPRLRQTPEGGPPSWYSVRRTGARTYTAIGEQRALGVLRPEPEGGARARRTARARRPGATCAQGRLRLAQTRPAEKGRRGVLRAERGVRTGEIT